MTFVTAELDLVVAGMITVAEQANRKQFNKERDLAKQVQQQLAAAGVVFDFLKDAGKTAWTGGIETMGDLYQLSRLAVYLEKNVNISGVLSDGPVLPEKIDPRIMTIWSGKAKTRFPHLVFLKSINSYYLPVDFAAPLWLPFKNAENKLEEAFFGSSVHLEQELLALQPMLDQTQVPADASARRCLDMLLAGARTSQATDLLLIVW